MFVNTLMRLPGQAWDSNSEKFSFVSTDPQLILVFGERRCFDEKAIGDLQDLFPDSLIASCSTSGTISGAAVTDDSLCATALHFEETEVLGHQVDSTEFADSRVAGQHLAKALYREDLVHVLLFSDGQTVNGAQLVLGFRDELGADVSLSGGIAGDGTRFQETWIGLDENPVSGRIVGIGFYGTALQVRCSSGGGWHPFGPERTVSHSEGKVLFGVDGESALDIYKRYLGEQAAGLPASALKFPLSLVVNEDEGPVVRTILSMDEKRQSVTFASDIPQGAKVRLMRGFIDDLIEGANRAANVVVNEGEKPDFALCVSCVARRLVLGQRVEEELEEVLSVLGDPPLAGFYSYGEIGPLDMESRCQLHNQSISITIFKEMGGENA
ncbi:FIST signal transduction protein [Pelagicoccus albus]|uniref:FIST C-terminal domain-containing protein n=1 Tax=Pelagicoccus albus TaxID=415222 RepID=A0A7X1B8X9_9BACT|nr:FIST N-terminal domain-containing protein [Pelagicoccus albus]MBC2606540.1 FIST C-terminal domain-containing protein [Pelagicoccus albus]